MKKNTTLFAACIAVATLSLFLIGCQLGIRSTVETPPSIADSSPAAVPEPTDAPPTSPTPQPGGLVVSTGQALRSISPYLYGSNFAPWISVPFDLLDEANVAGITMLRFPGGEYGDRNNLTELQIDRFVTLARNMNAEPTINVRLLDGTPEQAAEMVRYANIEKGYGLTYWGIGNEPNLYPNDYSPEQFVAEWRLIAEAMLAVDPSIKLLGPEVSQYTGGDGPGPNESHIFLDAFLEANGDMVDVVTVHRYPFGTLTGEKPTVDELMASSAEWDRLIPDLRERVRRITGHDLPVGVTEINTAWTKDIFDDTSPDSYNSAIWLADVIGRMIGQDVDVMTHFVLQTKDNQGGWGLLAGNAVRPSYYVYQIYQRFGQELLYSASDNEAVQFLAARRKDGALTLLAINRSAATVDMPLALLGHPGGTADVYRLDEARATSGTVAEVVETAEVADGEMLNLPAYSATLYVLP